MLEEQHAMDFDDLLVQAMQEVATWGGEARIHLGQGQMMAIRQLRWILLDEYQDFSELYFRMLDAIVKANPIIRLVAVGDDWQAINSFAGAELRFFERFSEYFPGAETVGVTTNYRSDSAMVLAGNHLMNHLRWRGRPARISRDAKGTIEAKYLEDVWIEFRKDERYRQDRVADALYLLRRNDDKNPSESALKQAQALKLCSQIMLKEGLERKTLLLARTFKVYGMELSDFRERLIRVLVHLTETKTEILESQILAMTAHGSKGQEASTVIILDATQRQFPKIHPDNLLFAPFGVTPYAVLEEERRLFYVALTRAEHSLYILTDRHEPSPYLDTIKALPGMPGIAEVGQPPTPKPRALGELATRIKMRIEQLDCADEPKPIEDG